MRISPLWLAPAALALEACALGRTVRPEAFGPGKPMAVVTVYSPSKVVISSASPGLGLPGYSQAYSREELAETAAVFADTKAAVLRALASSRHFRLVPEQAVLSSGVYAASHAGDPNRLGVLRLVTPPGYKLLLDEAQVRAVARGVGARGGIIVRVDHHCSWGDQAGTVVGNVGVAIGAIDRAGQTIWMAHESERSDISAPAGPAGVDLHALRLSLAQSAERATRKILSGLDAQLRGG